MSHGESERRTRSAEERRRQPFEVGSSAEQRPFWIPRREGRRWRLLVMLAGAVGACYLYFALLHPRRVVPDHAYYAKPGPWAIAHRGGGGLWPENTLLAFEQAAALGVEALEMDLRVSADGVLVVMHDATVNRTTNGQGRVAELSWEQIRALDAAYNFRNAAGGYPYRGQGVRVPRWEEVLARTPSLLRLIVEMKGFSPKEAAELCRLIRQGQAGGRVLVASFNQRAMGAFRAACPEVATSATTREVMAFYLLTHLRLTSLFRSPAVALQMPPVLRGATLVDDDLVKAADALHLKVDVWTVNEEQDMRRLLALGVHGILTDYPDRLLRIMGRAATD